MSVIIGRWHVSVHISDDVVPPVCGVAWMGTGRGIERHKRKRHFSMRLVELNRHANPP
jgi:hypothetical protein